MHCIKLKRKITLIPMIALTFIFVSIRSITLVIYISILVILIISRSDLHKKLRTKNKLDYERKKWLYSVINDILAREDYSSVFLEYEIAKDLNFESSFDYEIELSIKMVKETSIPNIPDLIQAERELLEIEYRASRLLILLITLPLIFLMFHSIYQTNLVIAIMRLFILFLFIEISTVNSRNPYRLNQWGVGLKLLKLNRQGLIHDPLRTFANFNEYYNNFSSSELSIEPQISNYNEASTRTIALLILILTKIDDFVRKPLIDEFLHVTRDLPQLEEIHKMKWTVFSNQFIIIAIISVFFSAILSSIITIGAELASNVKEKKLTGFIFAPTPKVAELTVLFSIFLAYLFSKNYFSQKVQAIVLAILIVVGSFTYYFVIFLFSFLIS